MGKLMFTMKRFVAVVCSTVLVGAMFFSEAVKSAWADPLVITISQTDASFTPLAGKTLTIDTGNLPGLLAASDGVETFTISNSLIPIYNVSAAGWSDPFAGTGLSDPAHNGSWSVSAQTNVPGTNINGQLNTSTLDAKNSAATTIYMQVIVLSQPYSLPGSSGSLVQASTTFSNSNVSSANANLTTDIDSTQIGNVDFTSASTSPTDTISYTRGATYSLSDVFDISFSANGGVNVTVTSTVTAAPEPANALALMATIVPVGLTLVFRRRGKLV